MNKNPNSIKIKGITTKLVYFFTIMFPPYKAQEPVAVEGQRARFTEICREDNG